MLSWNYNSLLAISTIVLSQKGQPNKGTPKFLEPEVKGHIFFLVDLIQKAIVSAPLPSHVL